MATYNLMNQQVTTSGPGGANAGTATSVAPITSSTANSSGSLSNVKTGASTPVVAPTFGAGGVVTNPAASSGVPATTPPPTTPPNPADSLTNPLLPNPLNLPATENATPPGLQMPTGTAGKTVYDPTTGTQVSPGEAALNATKASGISAPTNSGNAAQTVKDALEKATPPKPSETSTPAVDSFYNTNETMQQNAQDLMNFLNPASTTQQLQDQLTKISAEQNVLAGLNTQMMDINRIMSGTPDDLRKEVQSAGGMATESQIMALSTARNKTLLLQANVIQNSITTAQNAIANDTTLFTQEKEMANTQFTQRSSAYQLAQTNYNSMVSAQKDAANTVISAIGYKGYLTQLQAQGPSAVATAEKALGLGSGGLENLVNTQAQQQNANAITNAGITTPFVNKNGEIQSATGYAYTSAQDFFNKTGMTIQQAQAKGMISDMKPSLDIQTKEADLALKQAQTYKTLHPTTSGTGSGSDAPVLSAKDLAIRNIIAANPAGTEGVGWGTAADAIDAKFGKGTATQYDSLLKSVYQDGQSIDEVKPLNDIQSIASAIINGSQPPVLTGLYSKSAAVKAELSRQGFDLSKASQQWTATQKFLASANSNTQLKMRQAESSVENSLANLQQLSDQMNRTNFKFANKAELTAAANGAMGEEKAKQAQALQGQVALITDELGQTFMGGNSPTDAAFGLAQKVLQSDFSKSVMDSQIKLLQGNLQYRKNSWNATGVAGVGNNNPYNPAGNGDVPVGSPPSGQVWVQDKASGQYGSVPENEFDANKYNKIQ